MIRSRWKIKSKKKMIWRLPCDILTPTSTLNKIDDCRFSRKILIPQEREQALEYRQWSASCKMLQIRVIAFPIYIEQSNSAISNIFVNASIRFNSGRVGWNGKAWLYALVCLRKKFDKRAHNKYKSFERSEVLSGVEKEGVVGGSATT